VLDWELATLGNPWADVAYLAMPYHLPAALASLSLIQPLPGQCCCCFFHLYYVIHMFEIYSIFKRRYFKVW
jgi:hypothetical protein